MFGKKKAEAAWSPYGHEPARRQLLNMRRTQVILVALALLLFYGIFLSITVKEENNPSQGSSTLETGKNKPVRMTVTPGGRPAFMDPQIEAPAGGDAPKPKYEKPNELVATVQPFLTLLAPLGAAAWLLSRAGGSARGKLAELNLGVYKGAMPYEMHTARAYKQVFTHRQVDAHVFGRPKEDFLWGTYLKSPSHEIRRLLGEPTPSKATIADVRKTGQRRAPTPSAPARAAAAVGGVGAWAQARTAKLRAIAEEKGARLARHRAQQQRIRALRKARRP